MLSSKKRKELSPLNMKHPGITLGEQALGMRGQDPDAARAEISKKALSLQQRVTQDIKGGMTPKQDDINTLLECEVASAYIDACAGSGSKEKVQLAQNGYTPTGQPSTSQVWQNTRDASAPQSNGPAHGEVRFTLN